MIKLIVEAYLIKCSKQGANLTPHEERLISFVIIRIWDVESLIF